jgi:hypothetical protein
MNADVTSFLSAHTGVLIKTGKPRFTVGADVSLKDFTIQANYTLDMVSRLELFDRMSISVKMDLDRVKQLVVKDDAQEVYLQGLEAFAAGELEDAVEFFRTSLIIDPTFTPAAEMLDTAMKSLQLETELRRTLAN